MFNLLAIINDIEVYADTSFYGETLGRVLFIFNTECDGETDVSATAGSYIGSINDSLPLNLSP